MHDRPPSLRCRHLRKAQRALSDERGNAADTLLARRHEPPISRQALSLFRYFNSSPEMIRLVVMMYVRFPLSLRNVEDLWVERCIDVCNETVRLWWNRFGPMFSGEIRRQRVSRPAAALTFMKKALNRHRSPGAIPTDGLRSYGAAMNELGCREKQEVGRWVNNRVENSHLSFRRRERAMLRFRRMASLQKFASVHANVYNHLALERHLVDRQTYKQRRSAALSEWQLIASQPPAFKARPAYGEQFALD